MERQVLDLLSETEPRSVADLVNGGFPPNLTIWSRLRALVKMRRASKLTGRPARWLKLPLDEEETP